MDLRPAAAFGLAAALAAVSCSTSASTGGPPVPAAATTPEALQAEGEAAGIHHLAEVAPGLLRGAQPEGDASFALLARLGVRTILSVDGARPDAEAAARHGIRYVHLPMEYSGIPREEQARIAKVARDLPGGLFVHCHHGLHRGPAACAVAWMARDGTGPEEAAAMMKAAGTDPRYEGLYAAVAGFLPPTAEEMARVREEELAASARVPDLVEAMVALDGTFSRMKAVRRSGWKTPGDLPDVVPSHEARILAERFREVARLDEAKGMPADFRGWLSEAEKASWALEGALRAGDGGAAASSLDRVGAACGACHDQYRNRRRW